MEFTIDAHVHSRYSGDYFLRKITPERILDRAIARGLNCIVMTDARADMAFDKICEKPIDRIKRGFRK
jgi:predicted metal-dependent phosphoesterase TrpH